MPNQDPHTEAENSTVDNWMGQEVNEDMEKVDQLLEESGGDEAEAERRFDEESAGAEPGEGEVKRAGGKGFA
jgi:hypothetical protein